MQLRSLTGQLFLHFPLKFMATLRLSQSLLKTYKTPLKSQLFRSQFHSSSPANMKVSLLRALPLSTFCPTQPTWLMLYSQILAVLYDGHEAARQEPRLLGTTENKVCTVKNGQSLNISFMTGAYM